MAHFVSQLLKDYESDESVNKQLDTMGYNIGIRIVEDYLARTSVRRCGDLRETADKIVKDGFKHYLGVAPTIQGMTHNEFSLVLDSNPLTEFVELPQSHANLQFSNIICGALRGALEAVHLQIDAQFVQDTLRGDPATEIRVKFIKRIEETLPPGED
uniref:Trafficking protein particle complex subunit n=1 Tax=Macrostomum lignano TaxID=282301 RepID=A0A1I8GGA3_9PLAT